MALTSNTFPPARPSQWGKAALQQYNALQQQYNATAGSVTTVATATNSVATATNSAVYPPYYISVGGGAGSNSLSGMSVAVKIPIMGAEVASTPPVASRTMGFKEWQQRIKDLGTVINNQRRQ